MKKPSLIDLLSMVVIVLCLSTMGYGLWWTHGHQTQRQVKWEKLNHRVGDAFLEEMSQRESEQAWQDDMDDMEEMMKENQED